MSLRLQTLQPLQCIDSSRTGLKFWVFPIGKTSPETDEDDEEDDDDDNDNDDNDDSVSHDEEDDAEMEDMNMS